MQGAKTRQSGKARPKGGKGPRMQAGGGIWTPANIVTMVRVCLVPLWLLIAELSVPQNGSISWSALVVGILYVLISVTDKVDGYLARSRNEITAFGKFLDPIADKLAVIVALCYLLEVGDVSAWVLLIIISREFLVSGLRMVVASEGVVVAASNLGKWKTAVTMVSICGLLFARALPMPAFGVIPLDVISFWLLIVAVVLTAWSGIDYFIKCWPYVAGSAHGNN